MLGVEDYDDLKPANEQDKKYREEKIGKDKAKAKAKTQVWKKNK